MPTCRYCGREIYWETTSRGNRPINPDGTLHHRTCRKFHAIKAAQRAGLPHAPAVPSLAEAENPNQLHFAF
ncbi:MAG: hypothetical protein IKO01_07015 [Kiritimatiellae bacterium]|nr:hypothetical protein [Kiritimatiellia bacterium]